jgi:hypothetical protein
LQVEWIRARIEKVPLRFVFESALELMSCTKVSVVCVNRNAFSTGVLHFRKSVLELMLFILRCTKLNVGTFKFNPRLCTP